jgi:hypothetical protein
VNEAEEQMKNERMDDGKFGLDIFIIGKSTLNPMPFGLFIFTFFHSFQLVWLKANYEEFKGASLPRCTLYEHYQKSICIHN